MKNNKIIVAYALLFVCFAFTSTKAETFTVTRTDDRNGSCVSGVDCSLREAINAANAAATSDTIDFAPAISVITLTAELVLSNNGSLLISGSGAALLKISGNDQTRVFTVGNGAVVSITDVTIAEGNSMGAITPGNGGGILVQPTASLTLSKAVIRNNTAVLINSSSAVVSEPHFAEGSVVAGTISGGGGGIYSRGNLVLMETLVSANIMVSNGEQTFGAGGGIYNLGTAQLINSTVDSNETIPTNGASGSSGGIYNGFQGTLTLTGSTVSNNIGRGNGGGINNNAQATLNITNSTISNNKALTLSGFGAGIINYAVVNVNNSTIAGNRSEANTGGGVFSSTSTGTFTSKNTIYADNLTAVTNYDFAGNFISEGYNLLETTNGATISGTTTGNILNVDPQLMPLGNYGGPTKTHALRPTSPAIDAGNNFGASVDQRGRPRPFDNPSIPNNAGGNGTDIGSFERQSADVPMRAPYDFDGDNKTDIGIFRPSDASWWYSRSSDNGFRVYSFGAASDIITPGDFTGDGKADIAIFRPSSGEWYIQRSDDNSFFSFPFGASGDVPVPADFDGDGKTDAAVFRPSTATWFIANSSGTGTSIVNFGTSEDKPVPADFDGDGKADIAIFLPSDGSWWYLRSSDSQFSVFRFGLGTDKPVQGDYSGDGKADLAVFRESTGEWFFQRSEDNSYYSVPFGASGDIPTPGDYDGDGKFDTAVFRPATANWFVQRSTAGILITSFGASGDRPIPNAFVP